MKIKDPQKCLYDCLFKCRSNILRNSYGQGPRTQNQTYFTLLHLHSGLVENIVAQSLKTLIYVATGHWPRGLTLPHFQSWACDNSVATT